MKIELNIRKRAWVWFWREVCRFAYRRLATAAPLKSLPVGIPSIRDPMHPCSGYRPRLPMLMDFRGCQGDGHYLCRECVHLDVEAEETDE